MTNAFGKYALGVKILARALRRQGEREGRLGEIAVELAQHMAFLAKRSPDALVDITLDGLARRLNRSRSAVVSGIQQLKAVGLLETQSSFHTPSRTNGRTTGGHNNVYRLVLPDTALVLIKAEIDAHADSALYDERERSLFSEVKGPP